MDKLSDLIQKRLNQHKLGDAARAAEILHTSQIFLQERLKCSLEDVKILRLKDGILYVGTCNPAWSQEVFYLREGLLSEIAVQHGHKAVSSIVIKGLTSL